MDNNKNYISHQIDVKITDKQNFEQMLDRFDSIKSLTEGYFHSIFSQLSIVVGQIELMKETVDDEFEFDKDKFKVQLNKISEVSDRINETLQLLQKINTLGADGFNEYVSVSWLSQNLKKYLSGFLRKIREKKNIRLGLEFSQYESDSDHIRISYVFDAIFPLLLNLFDNSVCNGILPIEFVSQETQVTMRINVINGLLSDTHPSVFIDELQRKYSIFNMVNDFDNLNKVILSGTNLDNCSIFELMIPCTKRETHSITR